MEVTDGKQFAAYMRTVRRRTLAVVAEIPGERTLWRLTPDSFSIAEIVFHIAAVEKALWGTELRHLRPGKLDEFPANVDMEMALKYMSNVRAESSAFWSDLTPEMLSASALTPTGDSLPVKRWLILAAEHEIHHRSFIHAYRKIWGLSSSPLFGLTFEELHHLLNDQPGQTDASPPPGE